MPTNTIPVETVHPDIYPFEDGDSIEEVTAMFLTNVEILQGLCDDFIGEQPDGEMDEEQYNLYVEEQQKAENQLQKSYDEIEHQAWLVWETPKEEIEDFPKQEFNQAVLSLQHIAYDNDFVVSPDFKHLVDSLQQ